MAYEVAFDIEIDWLEWIDAEDEWEADEIAERLINESSSFRNHVIGKIAEELVKNPRFYYIEPRVIGNGGKTTLTRKKVDEYMREG